MARRINLAFCGCGFLGLYHTGVVAALRTHAKNGMLARTDKIGGASAGALHAAMIACDVGIEPSLEFGVRAAEKIRANFYKIPWADLDKEVRDSLETSLPQNAHILATSRLFVSITTVGMNGQRITNEVISEFSSRAELIDVLAKSCYIPFYSGFKLPENGEGWAFDGGFTDNLPILENGDNILVSPFAGKSADISPALSDANAGLLDIVYRNTPFSVSTENFARISKTLIPPENKGLKKLYLAGYSDTKLFLKKKGMYEKAPAPDVLHLFDKKDNGDS